MRLPSLKHLKTFQVAGRFLSFKLAADELAITPSAVSHQIRNLEAFLGVPLFKRNTRSLAFTDAGRSYFDFLDGMFAHLESHTQQLWTQHGRDIVRLCVPPFFANEALLPRLPTYQRTSSDTDIRVITMPGTMQTHPAEADLSILLGTGNWPDLVSYRLFEHRLVTACAPSLLLDQKLKRCKNLDGQTLIVHELRSDGWDRWAQALGIPPPSPKKLLRFDSMSAVARAAQQGLGIALVSWPVGLELFSSGALVRLFDIEVETAEDFYVAHRPGDIGRREVRELNEWIVSEFQEYA